MATKAVVSDVDREARRAEQREKMAESIEALRSNEGWLRWVKTRRAINRFSFYNRLLIALQFPTAVDVRTYNAWKAVDRQVMKGQKGILILQPVFVKQKVEEHGVEVEKSVLVGFRSLKEFDVTQTDGAPLPERPPVEPIEGDSHAWVLPLLVNLATSNGYKVEFDVDLPAGVGGQHDGVNKIIQIGKGAKNWQVTVLIHELAHSYDLTYKDYDRSDAEVIVQTVTWMVTEGLGLDTSSWSTDYLAGWSRPDDKDALKKFAQVIDKTANIIEDAIAHRI